jgi:parallel beta-helix repeat protein
MIVESDNCKISNSTFTSHKRNGIFITHSDNNNISRNNVTDSNTGVVLEESENNILFLNSISSNTNAGIYVSYESNENTILKNNIEGNSKKGFLSGGICIDRSFNNSIHCNNFLENTKGWYFELCSSNYWNGNYWDRPRLFPKLILGKKELTLMSLEINIDWHPAKEPYDI